jgi:hypothetical protein
MRGDKTGLEARMDAALRSYAEPGQVAEPRVAVARILERAREEKGARQRWRGWWLMAPLTASLVVIVAAALVWMGHGPRVPEIAWRPGAPGVMAGAEARAERDAGRREDRKHNSGIRRRVKPGSEVPLPRLEIFPAPQPLTDAEQTLARFAATAPLPERKQLVGAGRQWNEPISIAELKIRPLDLGDNHESEGKTEREDR